MDLELNDVQQELGKTVNRLLGTHYDAAAREQVLTSEQGYSSEMWGRYAELGLLGLPFAEEYGGAGMGFAEVAVVMEAFGRALVLEPYLATVVLGGGLVEAAGTEEQKKQILPGVCEGSTFLAFAGQEPGARYLLTDPRTKAEGAGEDTRITGEKSNVLGGDAATTFVVSAAGEDGLGLYLVEASAEGVRRQVNTQADGLKSAAVLFDNAPAIRLGSGDATTAINRVIDTARAAQAAEAVGAMEVSLQMTVEYLKTREQFGAPIGRNQVLQHRAADMFASLEDAKSMALYAKLAIAAEGAEAQKLSHRDVLAATSVINRSAHHISQESIQLHGGIGMTMEYPIGHYAKRLTVIQHTFGDQDSTVSELAELGGLLEPAAADV